ncbi:MAG: lipopolysaccharide biosynthesis protein [Bacilli bacterium]
MKTNELKYGTILSYAYLIIYNIIQLIYTPILLNSLGDSMYGIYSLCISIVNYFTILDFGLGNAVIRYVSIYKEKEEKERNSINGLFFITYLILGMIAIIIGIVVCINVNSLFSSSFSTSDINIAKKIIFILILNIGISLPLSIFPSIITAYQKFLFLKIANIVKVLASTLIMIFFLLIGNKAIMLSIITLVTNVLYSIIMMLYAFKKLNVKLNFEVVNKKILQEIFSFSFFAFILLIVDKINLNIDMVILGKLSNPTELSIYSIASRIFQVYITIGGVISGMLLPKYTSLVSKGNFKLINIDFLEKSKWQLTITLFVCISFIIFGKDFINIWLHGNYYKSYLIVTILMISSLIPLSLNVANVVLQAKNQQKFRAVLLLFVLIVNIIISIPLCNKYGALGCAIGTAVAYALGHTIIMPIYYNYVQKLNMKLYFKNIMEIFLIHLPLLFVILIIKFQFNTTILINLILLIFYLIISFFLQYKILFTEKEKGIVLQTLNKLKIRREQ